MTKPKALSARAIRELQEMRQAKGLRLPDLAKELGVAERTLSRYFEGVAPRNNAKGRAIADRIQKLLQEYRETKQSRIRTTPPLPPRQKRVHVSGSLLEQSLIDKLTFYINFGQFDQKELASKLEISESHLSAVLKREAKASVALRERISTITCFDLLTEQDVEMIKSYMHHFNVSRKDLSERLGITVTYFDLILNRKCGVSKDLFEMIKHLILVDPSVTKIIVPQSVTVDLPEVEAPVDQEPGGEMFEHRFRLRDGVVISITLPTNLTHEEAERLSAFILLLPAN